MRHQIKGLKVCSRKPPSRGKTAPGALSPGREIRAWLGSSRLSPQEREKITRFSASALPVFIRGEEGSGRGRAALAIHLLGRRKRTPFIRLSCRHLTAGKFIETISRWRKGAKKEKNLLLTLYLESPENLAEEIQTLLPDLLWAHRLTWPGLDQTSFDVRFISSSASPPGEAAAAKRLRSGLAEALETLTITLEPLRERKEEIPRIACEILEETGRENGFRNRFSPAALEALQGYGWPGNLAELESVVRRSAALKGGGVLLPEDLVFRGPIEGARPSRLQAEEREPWFDVTLPTLAHEIKNPLVAINTFAHLLPEKYEDPEFRQEFSRLVNQDIRRINDVLENLLEFSQFSTPRPTANDLNFLLAGVLKQKEKSLQRYGGKMTTDFSGSVPLVFFDETQLTFVLRNILQNALAKIRPESPLSLCTRLSAEQEPGEAPLVDFQLGYAGREGIVGRTQRAVGFEAEPDFQDLSLILLLIRRVMNRNGGRMQVRQEGEEGTAIRLQFPAAGERKDK